MTETDPHAVDPADEGRHVPGDDPLWNESPYLDFVSADGSVAGYARIGLYPNLGVTWWTMMLVRDGRPLVASVAYDLPVPTTGFDLAADGYRVDAGAVRPLDTFHVGAAVTAVSHDEPVAVYRGDPGRPATLAMDLTWTTDGVPYQYEVTTRYEVPCLVRGEVAIGDQRFAIDGQGQRDHSWGERDWWAFGWCWAAARLDDGTRVHLADIRIPGHPLAFGYVQPPDPPAARVWPVSSLEVTEALGASGLPVSGTARVEPGALDLSIEPLAFGPVVLESPDGRLSRFPRAVARFTAADGRTGLGWIEWNQPEVSEGSDEAR